MTNSVRKSVLILDDDAMFRKIVADLLESRGLPVIQASTPYQAAAMISDIDPVLAIIDWRLPQVDGISWIGQLRERNKNFPIIFISAAWCDEKTFNWLRNILKVSLILRKPIVPDLFIQQIESLLPTGLALKSTDKSPDIQTLFLSNDSDGNIEAESSSPVISQSDPIQISESTNKNQRINTSIAVQQSLRVARTNYAQQLPLEWSHLTEAIATVQKEPNNYIVINETRDFAHRIRGTAGSVGYTQISELAEKIENLLSNYDPVDTLQEILWSEISRALSDGKTIIKANINNQAKHTQSNQELLVRNVLLLSNGSHHSKYIDSLNSMPQVEVTILDSIAAINARAKKIVFDAAILDLSADNNDRIFQAAKELRLLNGCRSLPLGFTYKSEKIPNQADLAYAGCSILVHNNPSGEDIQIAIQKLLSPLQLEHSTYKKPGVEKDELTQTLLRRNFITVSANLLRDCLNGSQPFSVCLLTIDDFANINIRHNLHAAEQVVIGLANLIHARFKAEDIRGRWGEDGFVLAFPGERKETISAAVKKLLNEFDSTKFSSGLANNFKATFSAGLADTSEDGNTIEDLLSVANQRLYEGRLHNLGTITFN